MKFEADFNFDFDCYLDAEQLQQQARRVGWWRGKTFRL